MVRHNAEVRGSKARNNRRFVEVQLEAAKRDLDKASDAFALFATRNRKIVSPTLEAEGDRLARQLKVKDDIFNTLSRQVVLARIEEEETRPVLEVIEAPMIPLKRSSPARARTVVFAGFVGVVLGCLCAMITDVCARGSPSNPDRREFLHQLRALRTEFRLLWRFGR